MKTVKAITNQLTDKAQLMQQVKEMFRELDPQFLKEEREYEEAAAKLRETCGSDGEAYLAAKETLYTSAVIYMVWQGIQMNLDIFRHPVHSLMHGDFEQLCQEERIPLLPACGRNLETIQRFCRAQPDEVFQLISIITDYYAYLETVGYKVAHYFGYRLADSLLYHVLPGYVSDPISTERYRAALSDYLQLDLWRLG